MIYNIAYYVVNLYLRKAPERFGGFYNADEVDMCSRLTSLPSSHLVLHPELCDIAIDKLVDSYVYMIAFLVLGYILSNGKDIVKGLTNWIHVMATTLMGNQAEKEKMKQQEDKKKDSLAKAAFTKQKHAINMELVKQLVHFLKHNEDPSTFKSRIIEQIMCEKEEYRESINFDNTRETPLK